MLEQSGVQLHLDLSQKIVRALSRIPLETNFRRGMSSRTMCSFSFKYSAVIVDWTAYFTTFSLRLFDKEIYRKQSLTRKPLRFHDHLDSTSLEGFYLCKYFHRFTITIICYVPNVSYEE